MVRLRPTIPPTGGYMTKKKQTELRKRQSFKLLEGRDDDLIQWLKMIPNGQKEPTILAALRAYMHAEKVDRIARMEQQMERMMQAVNGLPTLLKSELSRVSVVAPAQAEKPAPPPKPAMSAEAAEQRRRELKKATW